MKQITGTGRMPVSTASLERLALLYLAACCHLLEGFAIDKTPGQASHAMAEPEAAHAVSLLRSKLHRSSNDTQSSSPVVRHEHKFRPFGKPRYPADQPELTWADLAGHSRGKLGHVCESGAKQCGEQLVCRLGVCRHCLQDRECASFHICLKTMSGENVCVKEAKKAWEKVGTDPYHFLCTLLIFFSSVLAAAAGTGGGGMFVPLLVLFANLKAESAVPLSQCMIFFSSFCNLISFVAQYHTKFKEQPKIDYDCIVLFEPMLVLGVTFGVLLHRMSPQWFILVLLCITLGMALQRTGAKGLKQRKQELELEAKGAPTPANTPRQE
jgi:hypothetical protein